MEQKMLASEGHLPHYWLGSPSLRLPSLWRWSPHQERAKHTGSHQLSENREYSQEWKWILWHNWNWKEIKVVSWEQREKIFHNAHHTHQALRINLIGNTHRVKNQQPSQKPYTPYIPGVKVHFSNRLRWCLKNISPAYLEIWKVWLLAIGRLAACNFSTGSLSSKFDVVSHIF